MTIPRKKSRPIEVDGRQYRWMVRVAIKDDYGKPETVRLTIEDQQTGEVKQTLRRGHFDSRPSVTPGDVKQAIYELFGSPSG